MVLASEVFLTRLLAHWIPAHTTFKTKIQRIHLSKTRSKKRAALTPKNQSARVFGCSETDTDSCIAQRRKLPIASFRKSSRVPQKAHRDSVTIHDFGAFINRFAGLNFALGTISPPVRVVGSANYSIGVGSRVSPGAWRVLRVLLYS